MANNLRIQRLAIKSSILLELSFNFPLDTSIGIENIIITGASGGAEDVTILSVSVSSNVLSINIRPMVPRAHYQLTVQSTSTQQVVGSGGQSFIEDGASNVVFFVGQQEENVVRDNILDDLDDSIYNVDAGSLIFDTVDAGAKEILTGGQIAGEIRSANYVSIEVTDESLTRGGGPFDRFANEGVYQVLRVGSTITGASVADSISFTEFPTDPVSLQRILVTTEEISNTVNDANSFVGLDIILSRSPVIQLTSLTLTRGVTTYTYDIDTFKYGIKESKYDSDNSYQALDLEDDQVRLSNAAVGPSFPFPQGSDTITATYFYKKEGRIIESDSVEVFTPVDVVRESVPAVAVAFTLDNAPIIDSNGVIPTLGGVTWLDPSQNFDADEDHSAFTTELIFNTSNLPKAPGEYSVNYSNGQVIVFGVDGTGVDGTTVTPPVASYKFKSIFQEGLDYRFFSDLNEIASLPGRDLRDGPGTVAFEYEDTFADDSDFRFSSHIEAINERVENRLIDTIGLKTENSPVREVFRIFNETTGEIYTPTRISGNEVYFSSVTPPNTVDVSREKAEFDQVIQSQLSVTDELTVAGKSFIVFRISLVDVDIMSALGSFIGASFNSSLMFSDTTVFIREFFYDPDDVLNDNLSRLQIVGDYMANYELGVVYVAVTSGASTAVGDASYRRGKVKSRNTHVTRVDNVYRSPSVTAADTETMTVGTVADSTVDITDLSNAGERTIDGVTVDVSATSTVTVSADVFKLFYIYQVTDLQNRSDPIDFSVGATISLSTPNVISLDTDGVSIVDDNDGAGLLVKTAGSREYVDAERISDLFTAGLAVLTSATSINDSNGTTNYFTQGSDGYVDTLNNRVFLPTGSNIVGNNVEATYKAVLRSGASVLVDFITGEMFIDYTYTTDEILVNYEYGNNVLDWSISDSLSVDAEYFVTYRYGALRQSLVDNFGVLTSLEELSTIPDNLDRETYRNAVSGSLQSFLKGPTIPAIELLVEAFTQITPNITESVFLEWILGRDSFHLLEMLLSGNSDDDLPSYAPGKFGNGLLLNKAGQTAVIPANSNMSFREGTWESFLTPEWKGIDNDAALTFNILFDGSDDPNKVFIGANGVNPTEIPFTLNSTEPDVLGRPSNLHSATGYFIWFDTSSNKWRMRNRAPISEERLFSGEITTSGEFYDVKVASTADGYDGYDGYEIDEINDVLRSTDKTVKFAFVVDGYDSLNMAFDAYDAYNGSVAGFDGIDFTSDDIHYFFDTGFLENRCRMSLYKDGKGFIRYRIYDANGRIKMLSHDISNWGLNETHHIAVSWKIGTIEMRDELHLFVDGFEVPNTYRFSGYLNVPGSSTYMDESSEVLVSAASIPTVGNFDLQTTSGSDIVTSAASNFISSGVTIGSRFLILDSTTDGVATQTSPFVYVRSVTGQNTLQLEVGPAGSAVPYNAVSTLDAVRFSVNPLALETVSDPEIERVRAFELDSYGEEVELYSPSTLTPDYAFTEDGYSDIVNIYNGIGIGSAVLLKTYGLNIERCVNYAYMWPDRLTNLLSVVTPAPTAISKINVTNLITRRTIVDSGGFSLIATVVGGHLVLILVSSIDFCQPSNTVTGRRFTASISGDNIDFSGMNQIVFVGDTTDGYGIETLSFAATGKQTTTKFFTSLIDVVASFTPIDTSKIVGSIEIREAVPINWQENNGDYAEIHLSVQEQNGINGTAVSGTDEISDNSARFGEEDIGKTFNIDSPAAIAGTYTVTDVPLDPSSTVKDSDTVVLNTTWGDGYSNITWRLLTTSYGDSGFANGLLTFETVRSGGVPFLLRSCWYEIDHPAFLIIPWDQVPELIYIGSDMNGANQADAVIDEMRILDELSVDTGLGEAAPSSGRSITTDSLVVEEFTKTAQALGLFHFNDDIENGADFWSSFSGSFRQSENSVNTNFGQSGVFVLNDPLRFDNESIFNNDEGTIEFWVSPILDVYNDPTIRYYVDLSPELQVETTAASALTVSLPARARSVSSVTIAGNNTNYFINGSLSEDGNTVTLGQPLPGNVREVVITYVPITSQGDRFSIFKNEVGALVLFVTASGVDYQITTSIFWKKNTWHRVFVGWDLNNADNQDRLIMLVDGIETGTIRYGTGLRYGTGVKYGQSTVWGSGRAGTQVSRNILSDINLTDTFNTVNIGSDFAGQYPALARVDNMRFSSSLRSITYLGGEGPGQLLGRDLLFTSNTNTAQPVVSDALTRLLLDFDTTQTEVENLATIRNATTGIFDFFVEVIDTFSLADTDLAHDLIEALINRIKPAHTRAFVSFTK
jgi:hypothetical protein